jgi:hypothetical protein
MEKISTATIQRQKRYSISKIFALYALSYYSHVFLPKENETGREIKNNKTIPMKGARLQGRPELKTCSKGTLTPLLKKHQLLTILYNHADMRPSTFAKTLLCKKDGCWSRLEYLLFV